MIRRVGPVAKVGDKAVLLRVPVDVDDKAGIVGLGGHLDAAKGMLKQAAGAPVGFVDGLGVGVEKVGEYLIDPQGLGGDPKGFENP